MAFSMKMGKLSMDNTPIYQVDTEKGVMGQALNNGSILIDKHLSGKDKEEVIIDATRIIQMIQNNQTVSSGQEIDEYLLRQRMERELKYEFKQMQLEHEMKMKLIYRRMIEDMYVDMLNS